VHRELVECPLRAHLLHDADQRVDHEDDPEQRVGERPDREHDHEHRAEDRVEAREDVGLNDLAVCAAGPLAAVVHETLRDAFAHLRIRQPGR